MIVAETRNIQSDITRELAPSRKSLIPIRTGAEA
jgi:hypothetical protein